MLLTNVLLKPKSKNIMVIAESVVTGHKIIRIRERIADKLEFLHFDPYIQHQVLYTELKKVRSMK
ncbi:39S ribosomal protein L33, mitochondrial-like isoform X1 [Odontomachus brunneus]|uniref:39S ribosomal protein L33, mitochondrial-like isoform X1 n=1 Tax=Odontomachus brunneus TaxID=486640 RepID=UPI0013F2A8D8|nr:39S ribosomal protein L33, mitochondrial-like isoform X1 [Odontomachus brunneus]